MKHGILLFFLISTFSYTAEKKPYTCLLQPNQKGNTPLHILAMNGENKTGCSKVLNLFEQHKREPSIIAALSAPNTENLTPIDLAAKHNQKAMLEKFLETGALNITYFWRSIQNKISYALDVCIEQTKEMLDCPDPDDNCNTALHKAVIAGQDAIVEKLLPIKDLMYKQNSEKFTPFDLAITHGNLAMVEHHIINNFLISPDHLWLSLAYGHANIINLFIDLKKDDLNTLDANDGNTALHKAVKFNLIPAAERICEYPNVDLSLLNTDDKTPFHMAISRKFSEPENTIVNILMSKMKTITGLQLSKWAKNGFYMLQGILPCDSAIINWQDPDNQETALHIAARGELRILTLETLLASGANQFIENHHWERPEHWVAYSSKIGNKKRTFFDFYRRALHTIYDLLIKKKSPLYKDVDLKNPRTFPTYSITKLLEELASLQVAEKNTCIVCFKCEDNCIPCHKDSLCRPCIEQFKENTCPLCRKALYKFRCLSCHTSTNHGFICYPTYSDNGIHYLHTPCKKCNFPWLLLDPENWDYCK